MALQRRYTATLSGTFPNKILSITHNTTSSTHDIRQDKVVKIESQFVEATIDPLYTATDSNEMVPKPVVYPSANGDTDRYTIVNKTVIKFTFDDGSEEQLELQHTENANWNGGEETDIETFKSDWFS